MSLTPIDGGDKKNPSAEKVRQLKKDLPLLLELYITMAKLHRAKYISLRNEGFDEKQALELCKTIL